MGLVLSCLILFSVVLSCDLLKKCRSCLVLWCLVLFGLVLFGPFLFGPVFCLVWSCLVWSCLLRSCLVWSCLVLWAIQFCDGRLSSRLSCDCRIFGEAVEGKWGQPSSSHTWLRPCVSLERDHQCMHHMMWGMGVAWCGDWDKHVLSHVTCYMSCLTICIVWSCLVLFLRQGKDKEKRRQQHNTKAAYD